jgi:hypothetical protein
MGGPFPDNSRHKFRFETTTEPSRDVDVHPLTCLILNNLPTDGWPVHVISAGRAAIGQPVRWIVLQHKDLREMLDHAIG